MEGCDVVTDGEETGVVFSEVRGEVDLEARAVDDVAVQTRVIVVHLELQRFLISLVTQKEKVLCRTTFDTSNM